MIIGLTGGIGSGKTTVSKMLAKKGAHIIDADKVTRELQQPGMESIRQLAMAFGKHILFADGSLDRRALASIVFNDSLEYDKLTEIMSPLIISDLNRRISELSMIDPKGVVVLEAPLLIESGIHKIADEIWVVCSPADLRIERTKHRDNITADEVKSRINRQIDDAARLEFADRLIENTGSLNELEANVENCWALMMKTGDADDERQ